MSSNKSFQVAILVSVAIHSVFFLGIPRLPFLPSRHSPENLKITYYKIEERKERTEEKKESIIEKLPQVKKEEILKPAKAVTKKAKKVTPEAKRVTIAKELKEERKFETVIQEEKDDAKKATYISYYRAVREKIRQYADRKYPRNRNLREGEVFLSFVVASSGELLQIRIVDKKSVNSALLRNIAINSIRDASPFPPFPRGMSQYQITFNVIISFEVNR